MNLWIEWFGWRGRGKMNAFSGKRLPRMLRRRVLAAEAEIASEGFTSYEDPWAVSVQRDS
jgi:hypothetical protein